MNLEKVKGNPLFTDIDNVPKQYKYLTNDIKTEVIIVGGGVTGAILGYYFTKNNIDSVILEKSRIAHGSTSITTALLQYELDKNATELKSYTSVENIVKSYNLGLEALNEIELFANQSGNNFDFKRVDSLLYTSKNLEIKEMEEEFKFRKENDFNVEFLTEKNNPFSFNIKAGILSKNGGAKLDPYKFTHQLLKNSTDRGLKIYENTEVLNVQYTKDEVIALTSFGHKVKGKIIIVATGYDTDIFTKRNFGIKTTTFNIVSNCINDLQDIYKNVVIRDNDNPYNYFRSTCDNRLIIGGEDINFTGNIRDKEICNQKYNILEKRLKNLFSNINIDYKYCGTFASTQDDLGFLGKDPSNDRLWYCLGYGANGILFAVLGGLMLNKLYKGSVDSNLKLFNVGRFD